MKAIFAFLCMAASATALMAQTPTPTWEQRIERYQKSFKPELLSVGLASTAPLHYCVQPSPDRKSIWIKRCPPQRRNQFQLVPPLKPNAPDTKRVN